MKKVVQLILIFGFILAVSTSCTDASEEIFENADIEIEQATDEEDEQKSKPNK